MEITWLVRFETPWGPKDGADLTSVRPFVLLQTHPTAKKSTKVTIKAQKDTPQPTNVRVFSVDSSSKLLCVEEETT